MGCRITSKFLSKNEGVGLGDRDSENKDCFCFSNPEPRPPNPVFLLSRQFSFCYGHRLLNHGGKCAHPHGHNGTVKIVLQSKRLDETGMVLDFGELKNTIGLWIEENLDHRMILDRRDPLVAVLREMNEPMFLLDGNPTAENLAKLLFDKTTAFGFPIVSVTFGETENCAAEYGTGVPAK